MHLSRCQVPRPEGWDIPPRHPLHHDEPLPQLAPLPIPPVAVQPAIINYEDLLRLFRQPVYKVHHTWKAPMATIAEALLSKTISEQEVIATLHIAALHLFPGLLSLHINKRKGDNLLSPINWLRGVIASPDYAAEIIRCTRPPSSDGQTTFHLSGPNRVLKLSVPAQ